MARSKKRISSDQKQEVIGVLIVAFAILSLVSLFSGATGLVGKLIVKSFQSVAGLGCYFLPIFILLWSLYVFLTQKKEIIARTIIILSIIFLFFVVSIHFNLPIEKQTFSETLSQGYQGSGGGLLGALFSFAFIKALGRLGSYILLVALGIVSMVVFMNQSVKEFLGVIKKNLSNLRFYKKLNTNQSFKENNLQVIDKQQVEIEKQELSLETNSSSDIDQPAAIIKFPLEMKDQGEKLQNESKSEERLFNGDYQFPPISLLTSSLNPKNLGNSKELNENIKILEKTLESFGVKAKVVEVQQGPAITRYELQPPPGVKVSKIVNLTDDLSLALAASGVRIEAPVPGKAVVGIEVPNKETSLVCFREIITTDKFQNALSKLTIALGKDITGSPIIADLAKMPHLLIAGTTGSGKSVCVNTLITSILYKARPDEVKFLLIDPKMVELVAYNGIPHLISPVVTQARKAASALKWAVQEMEKRYQSFAEAGVRNIEKYNQIGSCLPYIVVVIDELADLMMVAPNDVEDAICRLAQMARAAGIHLVVATQRPSVDVITGVIKSNIASRVAFAVSSQVDSRTILDSGGAEKLLGKGDMLFSPIGALRPLRVQGAFISDKEVEGVVTFLKEQEIPTVQEEIPLIVAKETSVGLEEEDSLFYEAVKVILDSKQASVSLLQRKLRVGYARAARLIDLMEQKGIVGPYEGSKPRELLVGPQHWEQLFPGINRNLERNNDEACGLGT